MRKTRVSDGEEAAAGRDPLWLPRAISSRCARRPPKRGKCASRRRSPAPGPGRPPRCSRSAHLRSLPHDERRPALEICGAARGSRCAWRRAPRFPENAILAADHRRRPASERHGPPRWWRNSGLSRSWPRYLSPRESGAGDPSRRTRWLVHAAEEKRVFRTGRHDDRRVDEAAGLAAGESQVSADLGQETSRRAKAGPAIRRATRGGSYTPPKKTGCFGPTVATVGVSMTPRGSQLANSTSRVSSEATPAFVLARVCAPDGARRGCLCQQAEVSPCTADRRETAAVS